MASEINYQAGFNILMSIGAFLATWWMRAVWASIQALQETDKTLIAKLSSIEILVAGQYVRKEELDRLTATIAGKLDRIEHLEVIIASKYVQKTEFAAIIDKLYAKIDRIDEKLDRSK